MAVGVGAASTSSALARDPFQDLVGAALPMGRDPELMQADDSIAPKRHSYCHGLLHWPGSLGEPVMAGALVDPCHGGVGFVGRAGFPVLAVDRDVDGRPTVLPDGGEPGLVDGPEE